MNSDRPRAEIITVDPTAFARVFKLTTLVNEINGSNVVKPASLQQYAICASTTYPDVYVVELWHPELLHHIEEMTKEGFRKYFSQSCYLRLTLTKDKEGKPVDVYINKMASPGGNRGKALHEAAFRMSLALGAKGKVELSASWSSHIAHYKTGLRATSEADNKKIEELIKKSKQTGAHIDSTDLTAVIMGIPQEIINQKLVEFNIVPTAETSIYLYIPNAKPKADEADANLKFLLDDKASALDLAKRVNNGLLIEIDLRKELTRPVDKTSIVNMARLKSIIKGPWDVSKNFYEEKNWERMKNMAKNAITFAVNNLDKFPIDHIRKLRTAADNFLSAPINSEQDIARVYYELLNTLVVLQKPLTSFFNSSYQKIFLVDIYETFNDVLGTTMKPGFMSTNKPIHDLETYAETLKTKLMPAETVSEKLKAQP